MNRKTTFLRWLLIVFAGLLFIGNSAFAQKLLISPDPIDLGDRPIGAWMEPLTVTLENTTVSSIVINNVETDNPDYFGLDLPTFPVTIAAGETVEIGVSLQGTPAVGNVAGQLVIQFADATRDVEVAPITANAYTPLLGDVVENPFELTLTPTAPVSLQAPSSREFGGYYKNYVLSNDVGSGPNDHDYIYLLQPATDMLIDLNIASGSANFAFYAADFGGEAGPMASNALVQAIDVINDFELFAGMTYYLVGSSLDLWTVAVNLTAMPAPQAVTNVAPLDGAVDIINGTDLEWAFGANTLEYQLILGTTYPPATVVVDWTDELATTYELSNLEPNLQYFWQVNVRNNTATTTGDIWGFTTTLTPPSGLTGNAEVYEGEDVVLTWESPVDRAFLGYNIFRDGVQQNAVMLTEATYTDVEPAYNMVGYDYTVTAIFDEGESAHSDPFTVQVTGEGTLDGNVSDLNTGDDIAGATVTMTGVDEFGEDQEYTTTTDATGNYTADVFAGTYDITVAADGYIGAEVTGVAVAYGAIETTDFTMFETAYPVAVVTASEFGENILIEWSFDAVNFVPQVYPFESEGMSEAQIQKAWNGFLAENNFDATAQGSDRALVEFQVWREKAYLPGTIEMIGTTSQLQFVDFDWSVQDWGVYKWYVVAVYDLNESDPVGSNPMDKDMNTVVDVTVALNSADSPAGTLVEFTNVDESPELVYSVLLPASGVNTWNEFRKGTYDILVSYPGYAAVNETGVDIFDETSFEWLLEELLATPADLYVTPTGFATWAGGSGDVPFAPVMVDFNDGMPADWTVEAGPNSDVADNWQWLEYYDSWLGEETLDGTPFVMIDSDGAGSGVNVDGMLVTPVMDASGADMLYVEFDQFYNHGSGSWASLFGNVDVYDGTAWVNVLNQTAEIGDFSAPDHKVLDVTSYANADFQVRFHYDDGGNWAYYWALDNISITNVAPPTRSFEAYKVFLDGTLLGEVSEEEYQHGGFGEPLVDGETYTTGVAAVFTTGQSATAEFTWLYVACDNYDAPTTFTAEQVIGTLDVALNWTNVDAAALDTISALRIYRNGEEYVELDFTAGAVDTYLDEELEFGTYNYCLTYIYDSGAETCVDGVCSEDVVITGGGYVNGTVTAFDGGAAIEGATITFANDDYSFDFTTDVAGVYTGEVVEGTYTVTASASTFESQTIEGVAVAFGETVTNDFALLEFPYPVSSVIATEINDNSVLVDWSAQAPVVEEWLIYDDDVQQFGGIGAEAADYSLIWASKFEPALLTEYGTGYVTKIAVYQMASVGDYLTEVRVMSGDGMNVLYAQDVTGTMVADSWNIVELDEAVPFDNTENLWIGMYVERPGDVFNEPMAGSLNSSQNLSDFFAYNGGAWTTAFDEYGLTNLAWMLRGFVTTSAGREVALGQGDFTTIGHKDYSTVKSVSSGKGMIPAIKANAKFPVYAHETSRELQGYNVYRTTCETGDLEFLGFTLDEQFTDNTWGGVEAGVYKWGVVAQYDNNESEVAFSNCLDKDMITTVSVTVTTNSGDSPEETDVMFTNISEPDLELVYEVELDETGFYAWDEFRKGVYDIYAEKNGFAPIELLGYVIDGPEAFEWLLTELLLPVADLYVTPTAFATWRSGGEIPFEPFMENFNEGLPETWTVIDGGNTSDTWYNETPAGNPQSAGSSLDGTPFMFADSDGAGSGSTMDEQLISPVINTENADELYVMFDYLYINLSTTEHFSVDVFDGDDWVEVFFSQTDSGAWPWDVATTETIDVTEYANEMFQVRFNYFSPGWNWYVAVDNVVVTDVTDRYAGRELQYYKVWLDGNFIADTENTYYQYDVTELVEGQEYFSEVAAVYSNGMSEKMNYTWIYYGCENYPGPENLEGEVDGQEVTLTWGGSTPPPPPGDDFFEDFEAGTLPTGWVTYDQDGDGYIWDNSAVEFDVFEAHSGLYCMTSASYRNDVGALNPNNWLVTPAIEVTAESELNFWVSAQDAAWSDEQYYVKVSTTGNAVADFTETIHDAVSPAAWGEVTLDLSAYAGETIYIAFQHADVTDMYFIKIDDVLVTNTSSRAAYTASVPAGQSYQLAYKSNSYATTQANTQHLLAVGQNAVAQSSYAGVSYTNREDEILWTPNWEDPQTTTQGIVTTYFGGLDAPTYSADDFIVPEGEEWTVSTLMARGFTSGGVPVPEGFGYTIFADAAGAPGDILFEEINTGANNPDLVEIVLDEAITLTAGTYWVSIYAYYANASTTTEGRWNQYMWNPSTTPGNVAMLNDIAGLFGGTGGFVTLASLGVDYTTLDFAIVGEANTGGGGGDFETGELLGANIYRDGELIAEMVTDEFYVDEDVAYGMHEYCVTFVYESGAESCAGNCIDIEVVYPCDAPKDLTGEYLWTEEAWGALIEWKSPQDAIAEWLFYDDGVNVDGIGGPATFTWAVKFDPAQLAEFDGASLTKISLYNRTAASNELRIYEGTNAATLIHTQTLSGLGIETWEEVDLTDAVLIDVTKELWIAIYTTDGANFPAGCGNYTGNPNSDLITLDGVLWEHLNDLALPYTWNLRGFVTTAAGAMAALPMEIPVDNYNSDDRAALAVSGKGAGENAVLDMSRNRELDAFNVYRSADNSNYSLIATVPFEEGVSDFEYFDTDVAIGEHYYQVTATYTYEGGSCESEPAMALNNPEDDFVYVFVTNINELGAINARMFPNPATNNVTIEANGMNRITVINAVGQVVYDVELDNNNTQLSVAAFEAGVYVVRINTETGIATKRLTIVR
ncbi:MAG: choice-of-anchor J domain-containing protein [Bacteroidales bacterium]|nr:choice-of-anchor J domain-containing protein [Bacteroidales bacterium]